MMTKEFTITITAHFENTGGAGDVEMLQALHNRIKAAINPSSNDGLLDVGTAELGAFHVKVAVSAKGDESGSCCASRG